MTVKKKPARPKKTDAAQPDLNQMQGLVEFMARHNLEEFEFSRGDLHIRLKKPSGNASAHQSQTLLENSQQGQAGIQEPLVEGPPPASPEAVPAEDVHTVKSPIVGTYFA